MTFGPRFHVDLFRLGWLDAEARMCSQLRSFLNEEGETGIRQVPSCNLTANSGKAGHLTFSGLFFSIANDLRTVRTSDYSLQSRDNLRNGAVRMLARYDSGVDRYLVTPVGGYETELVCEIGEWFYNHRQTFAGLVRVGTSSYLWAFFAMVESIRPNTPAVIQRFISSKIYRVGLTPISNSNLYERDVRVLSARVGLPDTVFGNIMRAHVACPFEVWDRFAMVITAFNTCLEPVTIKPLDVYQKYRQILYSNSGGGSFLKD